MKPSRQRNTAQFGCDVSYDVSELSPEEIIQPSEFPEYQRWREEIWWQVVRLNSTLFVLDTLLNYPDDLLHQERFTALFGLLRATLFDYAILIIARLVGDSDSDVVTIRRFKNSIVKRWCNADHVKGLCVKLKAVQFDDHVRDQLSRITTIRTGFIAHRLSSQCLTAESKSESVVRFRDLQEVAKNVNELFRLLCFGHGHGVLPLEYAPEVVHPPRGDSRSDIEYLLDLVAKDSPLLNMPEDQPGYWPHHRFTLTEDELRQLNRYRQKFGLPEV